MLSPELKGEPVCEPQGGLLFISELLTSKRRRKYLPPSRNLYLKSASIHNSDPVQSSVPSLSSCPLRSPSLLPFSKGQLHRAPSPRGCSWPHCDSEGEEYHLSLRVTTCSAPNKCTSILRQIQMKSGKHFANCTVLQVQELLSSCYQLLLLLLSGERLS